MIAVGRVQNGVIVLENVVRLPEGQTVTVVAPADVTEAASSEGKRSHSVLDIPTFSVGSILSPLTSDDDLLGEMLEGRL